MDKVQISDKDGVKAKAFKINLNKRYLQDDQYRHRDLVFWSLSIG